MKNEVSLVIVAHWLAVLLTAANFFAVVSFEFTAQPLVDFTVWLFLASPVLFFSSPVVLFILSAAMFRSRSVSEGAVSKDAMSIFFSLDIDLFDFLTALVFLIGLNFLILSSGVIWPTISGGR